MKSLASAILFSALATSSVDAAPNIVLIMADDLGYHDLACYGHPEIETPVLDQLASEGVRLTSFYAGATVCTPSRMALLTGVYPARLGWSRGVVGYLMKKGSGLSPDALTIAEILKGHGYRTGIFGKWHLGDEHPFRPHRQGFDETFYINKSNNQTKELWRRDEVVEKPFNNRLLSEKFTRAAIDFIEGGDETKPFFLYIPYSAPHFPVEAHPRWAGRSKYGVYGDVVEEMDSRIGEILSALEKEGIEDRTLVVFLSDNGPEPMTKESKADPLRGKKWSALEGGTRVPCILRWPGVIPEGSESDALIAAIDLLPTLCRAAGIGLGAIDWGTTAPDGVDVLDTLTGEAEGADHARKELLYWHGADGFQAIRVGEWKLFPNRKHAGLKHGSGPALFNVASDPAETTELSERFPERVQTMQSLAKRRLAEISSDPMALGQAAEVRR